MATVIQTVFVSKMDKELNETKKYDFFTSSIPMGIGYWIYEHCKWDFLEANIKIVFQTFLIIHWKWTTCPTGDEIWCTI